MLNKKGQSKLGCLVYLAIFAYVIYLSIQAVPVLYKNEELRQQIDVAAKSYYQLKDNPDLLYKMVLDKAHELDIPLTRDDVNIELKRGEVEISAEYDVDIDFLFTKKTFTLRPSASMPIYDF